MTEKRVGGHVLCGDRWVPADLAEDQTEVPSFSMANTKDDLLAAAQVAGVEVDESMTKAEILEALNG